MSSPDLTEYLAAGGIELSTVSLCGIYLLKDAGCVVYVGQSRNLLKRVSSHIEERTKKFDSVFFTKVAEEDLNGAELEFIVKYQPRYNKALPSNNQYMTRFSVMVYYRNRGYTDKNISEMIDQLQPLVLLGKIYYESSEVVKYE